MATCQWCGGEGEVIVCIDDMCNGVGECIHGDGYDLCPECEGEGEIDDEEEHDDR